MPWKMVKNGSQWCIRKINEDGELGEWVKGSCHDSRLMTLRMLRALYVHAAEMVESDVAEVTSFLAELTSAFAQRFGDWWIVDADESSVVVMDDAGNHYRVGMDLSKEDFGFAERDQWLVEERRREEMGTYPSRLHDTMAVWEFKGKYPDVPVSPKVNLRDLTAADDDPFFVTLPIAKVNALSNNKRFYDETFVSALETIVNEQLPVALMGHLPPGEESHAFPPEAAFWVGAKRVGDLLWGKAYVPKGEARERIRHYKALGKRLATSIDATLRGVYDPAMNAMRMLAEDIVLHSIDFAPVDRAGIPALAHVPVITREMKTSEDVERRTNMDLVLDSERMREILSTLKPDDVQYLPDAVRQVILSEAREIGIVEELRGILNVSDHDALVQRVRELVAFQQEANREAVCRRIKELVEDKRIGVQIEGLRPLVTHLIELRNPASVDEVDTAFTEVMRSPEVRAALEGYVSTVMGHVEQPVRAASKPKYFAVPQSDEVASPKSGKYFNIP